MKNVKVLGTGCANCKTTLKLVEVRVGASQFPEAEGIETEVLPETGSGQ